MSFKAIAVCTLLARYYLRVRLFGGGRKDAHRKVYNPHDFPRITNCPVVCIKIREDKG